MSATEELSINTEQCWCVLVSEQACSALMHGAQQRRKLCTELSSISLECPC